MRRAGCAGLLAALLLVLAGAWAWAVRGWGGPGHVNRALTVQVAPGTTLAGAAAKLERAGVIPSAHRFRLLARVFGSADPIKAGEYRIPPRTSQSDILKLLQGGHALQRLVTIPEGWPAVMVQDALARSAELTGPAPLPAEGSVLPDSYGFERGDTRASVATRMEKAARDYLAAAWTKRRPGLVVKTPREALILASIVEKETGKPAERRMVAAVYANRLRQGMRLQADPTIIYPLTHGRPLGRRILKSEIEARNGYNTYAVAGLPEGPICNPGRASIDAVLDPAASKALYFVADGTGGHVFADTLAEHNANVAKWYALRRARGQM